MTAVEWLVKELGAYLPTSIKEVQSIINQAEKMEKQQQENFASWCIKKRVDFFDSTEIGETDTIDGNVSKYKMNELSEMYRNTTQSVV